jgi:hypothetical protein
VSVVESSLKVDLRYKCPVIPLLYAAIFVFPLSTRLVGIWPHSLSLSLLFSPTLGLLIVPELFGSLNSPLLILFLWPSSAAATLQKAAGLLQISGVPLTNRNTAVKEGSTRSRFLREIVLWLVLGW